MKIPKMGHFKPRNLAYVCINRKRVYLGKWGSPEAAEAYARLVDSLIHGNTMGDTTAVTLADLAAAFLEARANYYGSPAQIERFKTALEFPLRLYANLPVDEFGPLKLQTVRQQMMESGRFARNYLNTLVNCIRHVFKFGVERELVKPDTLLALKSLSPIKRGRSAMREAVPVKPVDIEIFQKTIEYLPPTVAAMVQLQRFTGMRPGEVCIMKADDVDTTVDPWVYTLSHDKTDYRRAADDKRTIPLGKRAQEVVAPFLERKEPNEYLFSPLDAQTERSAELRATRLTPITKQTRDRDNSERRPYNARYDVNAYGRAIARAAKRAGVESWSPNQLRHLYATEIRAKYGLEAAQIMLGHSTAYVTQIYAERDREKAVEIAMMEG
ncbi:MAG: site-specific integrase [Thermoguttaceae bacterium]|nr:site-specific integrase [Thermoguttaceae bacterium]